MFNAGEHTLSSVFLTAEDESPLELLVSEVESHPTAKDESKSQEAYSKQILCFL